MTLNDFALLFPEITNSNKSFFDLQAFVRFKKYPVEEFTTALNDFSLKRNKYAGYDKNPAGYLWIVITNKIVKWKGSQSNAKLTLIENLEEEGYDDTPTFELKSSSEKLAEFLKYVDSSTLRSGQKELVKIMIDVCKHDHESFRDFMKEVNETAQKAGFSSYNIRKLLERIRLNMRGNDGAKNLLTFVRKSDDNSEEMLDFMLSMLPKSNPGFDAYRFSEQELIKMLCLKNLFASNGFVFNPDRFPEVYFTDFENYRKYYPEFELGPEGTPDYLGIYRFGFRGIDDTEKPLQCAETEEGFIVLFKDKIEAYSQSTGMNETDVRFVVLMHELGHWFTHWAIDEKGKNWSVGYHLDNNYTHEALAQLIAYWASEDSPEFSNTLFKLSPKNEKGEVDNDAVYGCYIEIVKYSKVHMLNKIKTLRDYWILSDNSLIDFLKNKSETIELWIESRKKSASNVFIEDSIKRELFNHSNCSSVFKSTLDLKKLLELGIVKLEFEDIKNVIICNNG